jgi:glycosyltransferase involved in cell wall biosynthesis
MEMNRRGTNPIKVYYYCPRHPGSESMVRNPPQGIEFFSNVSPELFDDFKRPPEYALLRRTFVKSAGIAFRTLRTPRRIPVLEDCDLVHMGAAIVPITSRPWIVTVEYSSAFFSFDDDWFRSSLMRRGLMRALRRKECRGILAYSNAAIKSLRFGLGDSFDEISSKVRVIHHAISPKYLSGNRAHSKEEPRRILFVGNNFFDKGGRELFLAYRELRKSFDVELTLVTSVPRRHARLFEAIRSEIEREPGVNLLMGGISKQELWQKHYATASIFCLPTYVDTYPFVLLEAMANRLPIVTTNVCAIPEMVSHENTGLLVDAPISYYNHDSGIRSTGSVRRYENAIFDSAAFSGVVAELQKSLSELLEDDSLRKRFGDNGYHEVSRGKFSVPSRNQQLHEFYRDALER